MGFFRRNVAIGSLDILPASATYRPGDAVAGTVLLRLSRALVDAVVTIRLAGRELVTVYYTDSDGDTTSNSALRRLFDHQIPLLHGPLVAGDVCVPFSIPLPQNLLPTTERQYINKAPKLSSKTDTRLKIEYMVECELSTRDLHAQPLKQTIPLTIAAWPIAIPIGAPAEAHTARDFRYGFWTKSGSCALRVTVPTNVLGAGDRIAAHVQLTLSTPERLRNVALSLRRTIVPLAKLMPPLIDTWTTVCSVEHNRNARQQGDEWVFELPTTLTSVPLLPSEAFHHFRVAYDVAVACRVRGCQTLEVRIPVTVLPRP